MLTTSITLPECDKSFTRSDALAKHMRLQHSVSPPPPGRGGNRKRKRPDEVDAEPSGSPFTSAPLTAPGPQHPLKTDPDAERGTPGASDATTLAAPGAEAVDDEDEPLPEYLLAQVDPATGLILGRSQAMIRYILVKARHRVALEQHEALLEELRIVRATETRWRKAKEKILMNVVMAEYG
jgi:hypothetical protein